MQNARLDESQAGIKIARRNINVRYADDITLMAENEKELRSLLMKVKEESEMAGLKLDIKETKIVASGPITSWQIGKKWKQWHIFSSWVVDSDCSHEIKRHLDPWKKSYDQPREHIKKQRHYFADKGPSSQSYGFFAVVMYGCESWTIKKAECQRIDAFELWC